MKFVLHFAGLRSLLVCKRVLFAFAVFIALFNLPTGQAQQALYPGLDILFAIENTAAAERFDPSGLRFRAVKQAITRLAHFRRDLHALDAGDVSIHVAAMTFTGDTDPRLVLPWTALTAASDPPVLPGAPPPEDDYPNLRGALVNSDSALAYFDQLYEDEDIAGAGRRLQVVVVFNAERPVAADVNDIYAHMEQVVEAFANWRRANDLRQLYVYGFNPDNSETDTSYWGGENGDRGSRMGFYWGQASGGSAAQVPASSLPDRLISLVTGFADVMVAGSDYRLAEPVQNTYQMPAYGLRARFTLLGSTISTADLELVRPDGLPVSASASARVTRGDGLVTWEIDNPLPGPWQVAVDGIANGVIVDWVQLRPEHFALYVPGQSQQYQDVVVRLDVTGAGGVVLPKYEEAYRLNTALRVVAPSGATLPVSELDYINGTYTLTFTPVEIGLYTVELAATYGGDVLFAGEPQALEVAPTTIRLAPETTTLLQGTSASVKLRFYNEADQAITGGIQLEAAHMTIYRGETCGDNPLAGVAPVSLTAASGARGTWAGAFDTPEAGGYKGPVMLCATLDIRDALGGTIPRAANARVDIVAVSVLSVEMLAPGAAGQTVSAPARESIFPFAPLPVTIAVQVTAGDEPFTIPQDVVEAERRETGGTLIAATVQRAGSGTAQRVPLTQRANGVWSNAPDPDAPAGGVEPLYLEPDTYTVTIDVPQDVLGDSNLKFGPVDAGGSYTATLVRTVNPLVVLQVGVFGVVVVGLAALLVRSRLRSWWLSRYPVTGTLAILRENAQTRARTVRQRIDLDAIGVNHRVLPWGEFPVVNPPLSHLEVRSNERLWRQDRAVRVGYAVQKQPVVWTKPLRPGDSVELWRDAAGNIYYLAREATAAMSATEPPDAAEVPAASIPRPSADSLFDEDDSAGGGAHG